MIYSMVFWLVDWFWDGRIAFSSFVFKTTHVIGPSAWAQDILESLKYVDIRYSF